jgi:hypothetical protein
MMHVVEENATSERQAMVINKNHATTGGEKVEAFGNTS